MGKSKLTLDAAATKVQTLINEKLSGELHSEISSAFLEFAGVVLKELTQLDPKEVQPFPKWVIPEEVRKDSHPDTPRLLQMLRTNLPALGVFCSLADQHEYPGSTTAITMFSYLALLFGIPSKELAAESRAWVELQEDRLLVEFAMRFCGVSPASGSKH